MKAMDARAGQGANHRRRYGEDLQRRHAGEGALSCSDTSGPQYRVLVPADWWRTGHVGDIPDHADTPEPVRPGTQSPRPEALTFTTPVAHTPDLLTFGSDQNASNGLLDGDLSTHLFA